MSVELADEEFLKAKKQLKDEKSKITKAKESLDVIKSQIQNNKNELSRLNSEIDIARKIFNELSADQDFILPERYTRDVVDVDYKIENPYRNYSHCYEFFLILKKESKVKRIFRSEYTREYEERILLYRIEETKNGWKDSKECKKMLEYYAAIKKHIKSKLKVDKCKFSGLIDEGNEVVISADINEKDAFILKVLEKIKENA